MAFVTLDKNKFKSNFDYLNTLFKKKGIEWSVVSKILSGNEIYLRELLKFDINQICDSRVSNLKMIKSINPLIETIYIKPPAKLSISGVVKYADVSLNTEFETIRMLSEEAKRQGKIHKIIIMIELGELREGVMGDDFMAFYKSVFRLKNIKVVGIGTNLTCLYGVLPNHDKLIQLSLYEQLIEAKFDRQIEFVSGGSSVTIPLIFQNLLPKGINHFRVGETLFLGTDVYNNVPFEKMHSDIFSLYSEIIELTEKPMVPEGVLGTNVEGEDFEFDQANIGETSNRAIIDIGLLDVDVDHLELVDKTIKIAGASSDMIVIDLDENKKKYKVGDLIEFKLDYMGTLRILNSKYIEKKIK
ncbi:alanine/ornithine racemase family PLP-dependent enzyme [Ancylomarina euxinus]|uniref:Alanine/ornithine racemase family PLP-dependent enzyme n=1 Tax=Ancylomarina euxinus TaxID=2283627 RepID=A0A425Y3E7_9BACT|nr:alanine/ornithine racemase family PLP-dependent enzyme [Ancylomarina euxinus]MCZ4693203.1 alanine/ornithine racemase family PLP-dependent enzyme [Ancylomarina euxinus]MUP15339.1 alanine/ornithine racemase family PLP-dependent enzyme [Ancylomarina euxinus]RRG22534.1 alanine/ornithine racemase family PLP-dependent enzyme [Ancylomarina euxinus]